MQKLVDIMEKNVQWLAIAIGVGLLFWTIYGYVLQQPVVSTVAGTKLAPGDVDSKTLSPSGPAAQLDNAMKNESAPTLKVQDFLSDLSKQLSGPTTAVALTGPWSGIPQPTVIINPEQQNQAIQAPVAKLPEAAAPVNLQFSQGRSNVAVPIPGQVAVAGQPAPANAVTPSDRNWVTVSATIQTKPLDTEFNATKIPAQLHATTILRVEMVRQEQDAAGDWGGDKVIDPLANANLLPLPPPQNGPVADQQPYISWAEQNQVPLLQPVFYQVLQGDTWLVPGTVAPIAAVAEEPFDPSKVVDPSRLTPTQRQAYDAYKKQKQQEQIDRYRQSHSGSNTGPGARPPTGGPPAGGRPSYDILQTQQPILLAQMPPGAPGMPPPGYPGGPFAGGPPPMIAAPVPQPANANAPAIGPVPAGSFDPAGQTDITIWAHDDTVQPGRTYRYQLRYVIRNPVRQTTNVCINPKMADQFSITSANSDWTAPISIKSDANFFAVTTAPGRQAVTFEIFCWKNGAWQVQRTEASPGDMVGSLKGAGDTKVNFSTGLTLVDVRPDPHNADNRIIILTGDNGQLVRHDLLADQRSEELKKLRDLVNNANKPPAGTPGATPQAAAMQQN